ncbi:acetyltransferase [Weeksellaceae bacterium A-14]
MNTAEKALCIIGAGGFGREVFSSFLNDFIRIGISKDNIVFMDENQNIEKDKLFGCQLISFKNFEIYHYKVIIAIGEPKIRQKIVEKLPKETNYSTLVNSNAIIGENVNIGIGSIITAGCILTTNIIIGKHSHINLNTTIGHDCIIGNYFTTAPGVNISGECYIGNNVYIGTNASIRNGIKICDNVIIGMGAVVTKNINDPGIYIGNPLKKLEK